MCLQISYFVFSLMIICAASATVYFSDFTENVIFFSFHCDFIILLEIRIIIIFSSVWLAALSSSFVVHCFSFIIIIIIICSFYRMFTYFLYYISYFLSTCAISNSFHFLFSWISSKTCSLIFTSSTFVKQLFHFFFLQLSLVTLAR